MTTAFAQRGRKAPQKGAAIVEFALVLPFFLMLVFGIIEFSIALYNQSVLVNAARVAARELSLVVPVTETVAGQLATQYSDTHLIKLGGTAITIDECRQVTVTTSGVALKYGRCNVSYSYTGLGSFMLVSNMARVMGYQGLPSTITIRGRSMMLAEI